MSFTLPFASIALTLGDVAPASSGPAHAPAAIAVDLLVILAMATVVATVFRRFKLDTIPGFLLAGAIAGPHALGLVRSPEVVEQISGLATVLLMFGIGLHLDVGTIKRGMVHILAIGVASTLAFTALAWVLLAVVGLGLGPAMVLAMALSMSSTAVFVRVLSARREFRSQHGRVGLGVAIVQDLYAVAVLAIVPAIAAWAAGSGPSPAGEPGLERWIDLLGTGATRLAGVACMILFGKYVLPRLLREVTRVGSSELLIVLSGALALGAALATAWLGFSPEMGAFLAGFLLAATPYRYQLAGQLAPMRDLFMAVFFTAVGLSMSPRVTIEHWWIVLLGAAGVMVLKGACIAATGWALGMTAPSAFLASAYLANAGEFTLVVLAAGRAAGIIDARTQAAVIAIVIVSLVIAPSLTGPAHRMAHALRRVRHSPWIRSSTLRDAGKPGAHEPGRPPHEHAEHGRHAHDPHPFDAPHAEHPTAPGAPPAARPPAPEAPGPEHDPRRIIIAGFGPVGRALADRFDVMRLPYSVIELNPRTVERQGSIGRHIVFGDVTNAEVLESAGVAHADAVILTIPDEDAVLRACQAIRQMAPDVFIAARTNFLSQAFRAQQLGADMVVVEEVATAQAMEREVLMRLGKRWQARAGAAAAPAPDQAPKA